MRDCFLLLILLILGLGSVAAAAIPQGSYTHCKWFKGSPSNYKFYWSYNETHIHAAMEGHTRGWIGLGISTDGSMTSEFKGSDIVVGWVDPDGNGVIKDYVADVHTVPTLDAQGSQDVTLVAAKQTVAGLTTIEWIRKLDTGRSDDRVFRVDGRYMYLIWALGEGIPTNEGRVFNQHFAKGAAYLNLTEPSPVCPPSPPPDTDAPISHSWTSESKDFTLKWSIVEQTFIDIQVDANTRGWIGVGFSDTNSMFYSDMIVGWVEDATGTVRVLDAYCGDQRVMPQQDVYLGGSHDVQIISGKQVKHPDGQYTTTLKYRRPLITNDMYDLDIADRDIYVLFAIGARDGTADGNFAQHSQKGIVRMNLKTGTMNSTVEAWVENPRTTLRSTHGAFMIVGWLLFMTIGRFVAAYGRGIPNWWTIHVACQGAAMFFISIAFALILRAVGTQGKHFTSVHGILGVLLVVGAFVQTALGAMAHFLRSTNSPLFPNGIHQYLGHIIWWGAIYNIPLGLRQYQIAPFTHQGNAFWALWTVWLVVVVGTTVYIFWLKWIEHKRVQEEKARARAQGEQDPYDIYTASHYDPSLINQLERVEKSHPGILEIVTSNKVLTACAVLHVAFILALAFLFTSIANTKPAPPYHYCPNCTETNFKFNNFQIPIGAHPADAVSSHTAIFCKGFDFGNTGDTYHIVEITPSVTTGYVSNMKLYSVPYSTEHLGHFACLDILDDSELLYGWSIGMGPFVLPTQAGIRVGANTNVQYVVLQIHYELSNVSTPTAVLDSSGIVVKKTTTLRPIDAGIMAIGVTPSTISLDANKHEVEIAGACSADKTSSLTHPLHVFAVSYMTRKYGILGWLEQWTPSGITHVLSFNNLIGTGSHILTPYAPLVLLSPSEATIHPGDQLIAHCMYNTTTAQEPVLGGNGAFEELCWTWVWYYPKTDATRCSSAQSPFSPGDGHFRPDRNASISL